MQVPFQMKFMALSWTSGELLCLIYLRWLLFDLLKISQKKQTAFFIFCVISIIFLVWILYDGLNIICHWLEVSAGLEWFHSHLLWKFFVTLWVGIEGVCLIYGFRIYGIIKSQLHNVPFCPISASDSNSSPRNTSSIPAVKIFAFLDLGAKLNILKLALKSKLTGYKFTYDISPISYRGWVTAFFLLSIFTFYFYYFYNAMHVFHTYGLAKSNLYNISSFYLRICGVCFNVIEWLIALLLFRGYVLLKNYYPIKVIS